MNTRETNQADTRQRLLEAAGQVFADRGFEKATIREIVDRANANLNAVNYHFRDKRGLYLAVFEYAHELGAEQEQATRQTMESLAPKDRLRLFVLNTLRRIIASHKQPWPSRLLHRELIEPTGALDMILEQMIRPRFTLLKSIVRELLPEGTPELKVALCAESVIGQCIHIGHGRPVVGRLIPELDYSPQCIEAIADHVTSFSLAAFANLESANADS